MIARETHGDAYDERLCIQRECVLWGTLVTHRRSLVWGVDELLAGGRIIA